MSGGRDLTYALKPTDEIILSNSVSFGEIISTFLINSSLNSSSRPPMSRITVLENNLAH